jgi:multiple sugar transport system permease protein
MLRGRVWRVLTTHSFMIIGSAIVSLPLAYALAGSFQSQAEYARVVWFPIPSSLDLQNYATVLFHLPQLPMILFNTLVRVGWYLVIPTVIAILCGYVFARLRFPGRDYIFLLLLASLLMPPIVFQVPTYVLLARWPLAGGNDLFGQGGSGFVDQWPALLLPMLVNAYFIFLMRQFFRSIPRDYEEAARIDGANLLQVFWYVYVPALGPAIAVVVIFQSIAIWNDYLWPLIATSGNDSLLTVALGFQRVMSGSLGDFNGQDPSLTPPYPLQFAVAILAVIPPIVVFLIFQRHFVKGLHAGIKG